MEKETTRASERENQNDTHFDYKNVELLKEYANPHARLFNRRRTKLSARRQRQLATATKRARFLALIPYVAR